MRKNRAQVKIEQITKYCARNFKNQYEMGNFLE